MSIPRPFPAGRFAAKSAKLRETPGPEASGGEGLSTRDRTGAWQDTGVSRAFACATDIGIGHV
jgi:hypothetical protein